MPDSIPKEHRTIQEVMAVAGGRLARAGIETARLDARLLMEYVLGQSREELLMHIDHPFPEEKFEAYLDAIRRRENREPVAVIVGEREFWGLPFKTTTNTLDPRPASETLIESALAYLKPKSGRFRFLDLGTGTGCLLLSLLSEFPNATGIGVDVSDEALEVAKTNAKALKMKAQTKFVKSVWFDSVPWQFDVILSNPPYIPSAEIPKLSVEVKQYDPMLALDGGDDGLDDYRTIIPQLKDHLKPNGIAIFELGIDQDIDVSEMCQAEGLKVVEVRKDLAGIPRSLVLTIS